jgi:hypothetical protein
MDKNKFCHPCEKTNWWYKNKFRAIPKDMLLGADVNIRMIWFYYAGSLLITIMGYCYQSVELEYDVLLSPVTRCF